MKKLNIKERITKLENRVKELNALSNEANPKLLELQESMQVAYNLHLSSLDQPISLLKNLITILVPILIASISLKSDAYEFNLGLLTWSSAFVLGVAIVSMIAVSIVRWRQSKRYIDANNAIIGILVAFSELPRLKVEIRSLKESLKNNGRRS